MLNRREKVKKKIYDYIYILYAIIVVFYCYRTLVINPTNISKWVIICVCVCCLLAIIYIRRHRIEVTQLLIRKINMVCVFFLVGISSYCITGSNYFVWHEDIFSWNSIINFLETVIWVLPLYLVFTLVLGKVTNDMTEKRMSKACYIVGIVGIMTPCLVFLYAFNPAILSYDSVSCYSYAHQLGEISLADWQPPFYIFVLKVLLSVINSVTFVVILQDIYFAIVFMASIAFLIRIGVNNKLLIAFYIFITINFSNIIQLVTLWKDIPFMCSLLWLTLVIAKIVCFESEYRNKTSWYIQLVISMVFVCFFRQNGILPAIAIAVILPVLFRKNKKIVLASLVFITLWGFIKGPVYKYYKVCQTPGLKYYGLANDILYSYYYSGERSEDVIALVDEMTCNDPDNWEYTPYYTNYRGTVLGDYSLSQFIKMYVNNYLRNFRTETFAVLARTQNIWSVFRPIYAIDGCVSYLGQTVNELSEGIPERKDNALTYYIRSFADWFNSSPMLYTIYWRAGIYNVLIIWGFVYLLIHLKSNLRIILPFIPIVANNIALFISSGWSDYRYVWPSVTIGLVLVLMTPALSRAKSIS